MCDTAQQISRHDNISDPAVILPYPLTPDLLLNPSLAKLFEKSKMTKFPLCHKQGNTIILQKQWHDVGSQLSQRMRRWLFIEPLLGLYYLCFNGRLTILQKGSHTNTTI